MCSLLAGKFNMVPNSAGGDNYFKKSSEWRDGWMTESKVNLLDTPVSGSILYFCKQQSLLVVLSTGQKIGLYIKVQ